MCVHDIDAITLREYVETYREESENEYPVSVLDVLRPLSKHSFVSLIWLHTSKRRERTIYLPSTGGTTKRATSGDPSFLDC